VLPFTEGWLVTGLNVEAPLFAGITDVVVILVGHATTSVPPPGQTVVHLDVTTLGFEVCEAVGSTDADEEIVDEIVADSCVVDGDADDASPPAWLDGGCALDSAGELIVFCFCTTALLRYNNTGLLEMIEEQRY
jgi:hypothetical protein